MYGTTYEPSRHFRRQNFGTADDVLLQFIVIFTTGTKKYNPLERGM